VVINWGDEEELFDCRIRYGAHFKAPTQHEIEVEQEASGRIRFFDRDIILAALARANPAMKVAILLGINCAFYPGDTAAITLDDLTLVSEYPGHAFRRVKNGFHRAGAFWPETVTAIREYTREHRNPKTKGERTLLLTRYQ